MQNSEGKLRKKPQLKWNGQEYDKVFIIQNHDLLNTGFSAFLIYSLNGIRQAIAANAIPVIDFNAENVPYFYEPSKGENIWTYFFENFSPYELPDVLRMLQNGEISKDQMLFTDITRAGDDHQRDPDRLATFWAWEKPSDLKAWMKEKRALGRTYIKNYVKPKVSIKNKVEKFIDKHFNADFVIGVHIRGTDFCYARPTSIETYLKEIDSLLEKNGKSSYRIFLATDQEQYVEDFKNIHGEKVVCWEAIRSDNHICPVRFDNVSGFKKGEDVLIDMLLLSRCHHIVKGAAAVGELALWFSCHDDITDFALESDFIRKGYGELQSAYSQLNVAHKSTYELGVHKFREHLVRRLVSSRIGHFFFSKFKFIRRIMIH